MGSPLGPTLANALLNLNQFFVEDMLMMFLFYSNQPIIPKNFVTTLILVTRICHFYLRKKKNGKMSFLGVEISRETGKFVATTVNGVYTHFKSFKPSTKKFGMLFTVVYRCYFMLRLDKISYKTFQRNFSKEFFQIDFYLTSFIDKCFNKFSDRLHVVKPTLATVEKQPSRLVLFHFGPTSLHVTTKIRKEEML